MDLSVKAELCKIQKPLHDRVKNRKREKKKKKKKIMTEQTPTTMKAVVFDGPRQVSIQDRPVPKRECIRALCSLRAPPDRPVSQSVDGAW